MAIVSATTSVVVNTSKRRHNGIVIHHHVMTFYTCLDDKGSVIARCQTEEEIAVLKRMGRPIAQVRAMKNEEAVVCSLTGSPSDYNDEY